MSSSTNLVSRKSGALALAFALPMVFSNVAFSIPITYSDASTFLGAAGALNLEDFEDEAVVGTTSGGGVPAISFDFFDVTSNFDSLKVLDAPFLTFHNTTPGGTKYFNSDTDIGFVGSSINFLSFASAITEFALTFTRLLDGATLTVNGIEYVLPPAGSDDEIFFGIISDTAFTSVQISSSASHFAMDDVFSSTVAVPEPGTLALLGLGLAGMGLARRRKKV